MKLSDVQEIAEATTSEGANILLSQGWKLLAINPSRDPRCAAVYILGARTATDAIPSVPALPSQPPVS